MRRVATNDCESISTGFVVGGTGESRASPRISVWEAMSSRLGDEFAVLVRWLVKAVRGAAIGGPIRYAFRTIMRVTMMRQGPHLGIGMRGARSEGSGQKAKVVRIRHDVRCASARTAQYLRPFPVSARSRWRQRAIDRTTCVIAARRSLRLHPREGDDPLKIVDPFTKLGGVIDDAAEIFFCLVALPRQRPPFVLDPIPQRPKYQHRKEP